jgi:hypothetical protein
MKGSYKTPSDTKEPLDYSYIAGNGKIIHYVGSELIIKSV